MLQLISNNKSNNNCSNNNCSNNNTNISNRYYSENVTIIISTIHLCQQLTYQKFKDFRLLEKPTKQNEKQDNLCEQQKNVILSLSSF